MSFEMETIAACTSAIAAVVALGISCWQTSLSNRQSLFIRRLNLWVITEKLIYLYRDNICEPEQVEGPELAIGLRYAWLTNTTFLHEITPCISHVLENEYQLKFHLKLDELNSLAIEALFIFKEKYGRAIANFLGAYQALLSSMYQYQILLDRMQKNMNDFGWTFEEAANRFNEIQQREELSDAESDLKAAYDVITDVKIIGKIEKQIRLVRVSQGPLNPLR